MDEKWDYRRISGLSNYIERVGAEQLNFRKFMIKIHVGVYYEEKCIIRILADGTIDCSDPEFAPYKSEQELFKEYLVANELEFPKSINATQAQYETWRDKNNFRENSLFKLLTRDTKADNGNIKMVQQRLEIDNKKMYVPWTFWSDGEWRCMEPDGALPFWKPGKPRADRIMIHEGAKAARHVDWHLNEDHPQAVEWRKTHPWAEELAQYEHWGLIGGALAPQRADYAELRREKPVEVVYICDNDEPGKKVPGKISKLYSGTLRAVRLDERWPPSWDLADPMPSENLFPDNPVVAPNGKWIGPSLKQMFYPCTAATEEYQDPENPKKKIYVINKAFVKEWMRSVQPEFFYNDLLDELLSEEGFNSYVAPYSHVKDVAALFRKEDSAKVLTVDYDPTLKSGQFNSKKRGNFMNTHRPSDIKPKPGDVSIFLKYIENLLPLEKDRIEVLRWCATLVCKPAHKMKYAVLLSSGEQGVGKSTLGEKILTPLVGEHNASTASQQGIIDSPFNAWARHKRLCVVHEIYAGKSSKAYDTLKNYITEETYSVSMKYVPGYEARNWLHILACSNSPRALKLDPLDRRWLVPKVSDNKMSPAFWLEFNDWLRNEEGLEKIAYYFRNTIIKEYGAVNHGEEAPMSDVKKEMIHETLSDGQKLVLETLEHIQRTMNGKPYFLLDTALVDLVRMRLYDGKRSPYIEKPSTIRKLAKNHLGWKVGEVIVKHRDWKAYYSKIMSPDPAVAMKTVEELLAEGLSPIDPSEHAQM